MQLAQLHDVDQDSASALVMYRRALETTVVGLDSSDRAAAFAGAVRCLSSSTCPMNLSSLL